MILIGYASRRWQKICEQQKEAKKALSQRSASLVAQRLVELAAFENLGQIPLLAPPLHFHPLRHECSGLYVVKLHGGDGIRFRPAGDFSSLEDGSPNLASVTEIEIDFIGNYHGNE